MRQCAYIYDLLLTVWQCVWCWLSHTAHLQFNVYMPHDRVLKAHWTESATEGRVYSTPQSVFTAQWQPKTAWKIHKGCNIGTKSRINSKCYIHTCRSVGNIVYVIFFQIHINFAFNFTSRNCLWLQMQVWALYETLSDWLNNGSLTDPPCCTSITSLNMDVVYSLEKQFVRGAANGLKM